MKIDKEKLIECLDRGYSVKRIARIFGCSLVSVYGNMKSVGITTSSTKWNEENVSYLLENYSPENVGMLAVHFGITKDAVRTAYRRFKA